jgi:hypothetical protein
VSRRNQRTVDPGLKAEALRLAEADEEVSAA